MLDTKTTSTWCPGCVIPDTIIHTNPGFKEIQKLSEGEMVLGNDGKFHRITKIFRHRYEGKIYRIRTKCFGETVLTPEHPVLVSRRESGDHHNKSFEAKWVEAADLRHGDYLLYPIPKETRDMDVINLGFERLHMDRKSKPLPEEIPVGDFARLAGYYIAEGHVHDREICFSFNSKEIDYASDVQSLVKKLFGLEAKIKYRRTASLEVYVSSSVLSRKFGDIFGKGAENKHIPDFLVFLPPHKQRELIKGLWRGDGWFSETKHKSGYKTISRKLAEQLKMLLLRQKIVPLMFKERAKAGHREAYSIFVVNPRDFDTMASILDRKRRDINGRATPVTDDYAYLPIKEIEKVNYDGDVWNLEVADVECYVTQNAILHNCGNFSILATLNSALTELKIEPHDVLLVAGVGCHGHTPQWIRTYGFQGIHGRPLPVAQAAKIANHELEVIVLSGDGDCFDEGMNHFIHACQRNIDIALFVHNNGVFGLTTGQTSPTAGKGYVSKSTPFGSPNRPINQMTLALDAGATFVGRGFAGDPPYLTMLMEKAITHKGFAFLDILQPCVTWNKVNTYDFWRKNTYKLETVNHDPSDLEAAWKRAREEGPWPLGVFYKTSAPSFADELPQISREPLVKHSIDNIDIAPLLKQFE